MNLVRVLWSKACENNFRRESRTEMPFNVVWNVCHIRLLNSCKFHTKTNDRCLLQTWRCLGSPSKHHISLQRGPCNRRRPSLNLILVFLLVIIKPRSFSETMILVSLPFSDRTSQRVCIAFRRLKFIFPTRI